MSAARSLAQEPLAEEPLAEELGAMHLTLRPLSATSVQLTLRCDSIALLSLPDDELMQILARSSEPRVLSAVCRRFRSLVAARYTSTRHVCGFADILVAFGGNTPPFGGPPDCCPAVYALLEGETEWLRLADCAPTVAAIGAAHARVGDEVLLLGGYGYNEEGSRYFNQEVRAFSLRTNQWRILGKMPPEPIGPCDEGERLIELAGAMCGTLRGQLIVAGGLRRQLYGADDAGMYASDGAWLLDLASASWKELAPLPHAVTFGGGFVHGSCFFVVGGLDSRQRVAKYVQMFDPNKGEWSLRAVSSPPTRRPIRAHALSSPNPSSRTCPVPQPLPNYKECHSAEGCLVRDPKLGVAFTLLVEAPNKRGFMKIRQFSPTEDRWLYKPRFKRLRAPLKPCSFPGPVSSANLRGGMAAIGDAGRAVLITEGGACKPLPTIGGLDDVEGLQLVSFSSDVLPLELLSSLVPASRGAEKPREPREWERFYRSPEMRDLHSLTAERFGNVLKFARFRRFMQEQMDAVLVGNGMPNAGPVLQVANEVLSTLMGVVDDDTWLDTQSAAEAEVEGHAEAEAEAPFTDSMIREPD